MVFTSVLWSPDFYEPQFPYLILSRLSIQSCEQDFQTVKLCYKCKVVSVNYWVLEGKAVCSILGLLYRLGFHQGSRAAINITE